MKKILLIFYCLVASNLYAQHFNTVYRSNAKINIGARCIELNDGGYLMCTEIINNNNEVIEGLVKLNADGDTIWQKKYNETSQNFYASGIAECSDGFLTSGTVTNSSGNIYNFYIHKFDFNGNNVWIKKFGNGFEIAYNMLHLKDYSIIIGQSTDTSRSTGIADVYAIKIDSLGNKIWDGYYGRNDIEIAHGICTTNDNGYIISGASTSAHNTNYNHYLVKIDSAGKKVWENNYGDVNNDYSGFITRLRDNNYVYASASGDGNGNDYGKLMKINNQGAIIWEKHYLYGALTAFNAPVVENNDGSLVGVLINSKLSTDPQRAVMIKVSSGGDSIWTKKYVQNSVLDDYFYDINITKDKGFIVCGSSIDSLDNNLQYAWLIKTDCNGNDSIHYAPDYNCIDIPNAISQIDLKNKYLNIYPNPFSKSTTINYNILPDTKSGLLNIYNLQGEIVKMIILNANLNTVDLNLEDERNGFYYCQLVTDGKVIQTEKLVLIK